jgi:hypothetical protein
VLIFNRLLGTSVIAVTVAKSKTFHLHSSLLAAESQRFSKSLNGSFKEAEDKAIKLDDEDPDLFGFFIEYLYRDHSILSRGVQHYSEYVTLARLYALGERLVASNFQSRCLWRFTEALNSNIFISDESICELLNIACTDITERMKEDPMRAQIFWYGGCKIANLQKSDKFRQLLYDVPDLGRQLCLWMGKAQPQKPATPNQLQDQRFAPESEYSLQRVLEVDLKDRL